MLKSFVLKCVTPEAHAARTTRVDLEEFVKIKVHLARLAPRPPKPPVVSQQHLELQLHIDIERVPSTGDRFKAVTERVEIHSEAFQAQPFQEFRELFADRVVV